MTQAINAYRSITATDEFKEIERLRSRALNNEASALGNARRQEAKKWQGVVAEVVAEKERALAKAEAVKERAVAEVEAEKERALAEAVAEKERAVAEAVAAIEADKDAQIAELLARRDEK